MRRYPLESAGPPSLPFGVPHKTLSRGGKGTSSPMSRAGSSDLVRRPEGAGSTDRRMTRQVQYPRPTILECRGVEAHGPASDPERVPRRDLGDRGSQWGFYRAGHNRDLDVA